MQESHVVDTLVEELSGLPGIGKKTAQRLTFYIMKMELSKALSLSEAIKDVREKIMHCSRCYNFTEIDPCEICSDAKRDRSVICVVENPSDVNAIEKAGVYRGVYHVLGGALSPLDNIGPDELHLKELTSRLNDTISEVIIATNPTVEGESTATFLADLLSGKGMRVTRIARGLPAGSDLELADKVTLARSFEGRLNLK
ncbi:MAG: recombination protein RecR [Candidatus Latescibacteria bacterium]|jgi:recombination protein RecR|nr:recombination protein RecR [Candidatus Latescibacterota bacterium]